MSGAAVSVAVEAMPPVVRRRTCHWCHEEDATARLVVRYPRAERARLTALCPACLAILADGIRAWYGVKSGDLV